VFKETKKQGKQTKKKRKKKNLKKKKKKKDLLHETSCCTEGLTGRWPVACATADAAEPVAENAQQDPHCSFYSVPI
jgi:hypothetical protein